MPNQDSTIYLVQRAADANKRDGAKHPCGAYWTVELAKAAQATQVRFSIEAMQTPSIKLRSRSTLHENEVVIEKFVPRSMPNDDVYWTAIRRYMITPMVVHGSAIDRLANVAPDALPTWAMTEGPDEPCDKCEAKPTCVSPNGKVNLCVPCLFAPHKAAADA